MNAARRGGGHCQRALSPADLSPIREPHILPVRVTPAINHRTGRYAARLRNGAQNAVSRVQRARTTERLPYSRTAEAEIPPRCCRICRERPGLYPRQGCPPLVGDQVESIRQVLVVAQDRRHRIGLAAGRAALVVGLDRDDRRTGHVCDLVPTSIGSAKCIADSGIGRELCAGTGNGRAICGHRHGSG